MSQGRLKATEQALVTLDMTGKDVSRIQQEAGVQRVQRCGSTEKRGRVHSSSVAVTVLDGGIVGNYTMREQDFVVTWFGGTGAGGQHRNKTRNCARVTYLPTGTIRCAQTRSRQSSYAEARAALEADVRKLMAQRLAEQRQVTRGDQIGEGQRIRTWRFRDDEVVDHRSGRRGRVCDLLNGHFGAVWESCQNGS